MDKRFVCITFHYPYYFIETQPLSADQRFRKMNDQLGKYVIFLPFFLLVHGSLAFQSKKTFYKMEVGIGIAAVASKTQLVNDEHQCLGECLFLEQCKSFAVLKVDESEEKYCYFYNYDRCDKDLVTYSQQHSQGIYFDQHSAIDHTTCSFHLGTMNGYFWVPVLRGKKLEFRN